MADCPNRDKTCDTCGKTGHLKIKCRMESRQTEKSAPRERRDRGEGKDSRGRSDAGKTCNNCGEFGHLAGACPEPNQCHACGSTDHSVADCPNKEKTCDVCGKTGHLRAKCRQESRRK